MKMCRDKKKIRETRRFWKKLGESWVIRESWQVCHKRCIPENSLFGQHDHTIEYVLTQFDSASVFLHYITTYDPILFCYFMPTFMFFLHSLPMNNIWDRWKNFLLLDSMTRLPRGSSIGGILLGNNNKSDGSIFLFDESIFLFLD